MAKKYEVKVDIMTKTRELIGSGWKLDNSYTQLPKLFFTSLNPTPVSSPGLVILNIPLAKSIGLDAEALQGKEGIEILAGNRLPEGAFPIAQAYAGHQFGYFTILGDGRAILLGEQITPSGDRVDIQLKGSGRTPYSRQGDGRAAIGPMLREYIISEAMHGLGIDTTRSLAVVTTGEDIVREGRLPGGILARVASSHIRVGTFEYAAEAGNLEDLKALADYTLQRHFQNGNIHGNPYIYLLKRVVKNQANLIARWQLVGFIHGVMNTDNMAISGETIDYGPCAFMDTYNPKTVFSSIDTYGRYAYNNQPRIAQWNLARFAEALLPLLDDKEDQAIYLAQDIISRFMGLYENNWLYGMRTKLGIFNEESEDKSLVKGLLNIMHKYKADYTNTFLALTFNRLGDKDMFKSAEFTQWHDLWQARLNRQDEPRDLSHKLMKNSNPAVIPRNHRVEEALKAAEERGDYRVMERLLEVLSNPYGHTEEQIEYSMPPEPSNRPYRTFCGT